MNIISSEGFIDISYLLDNNCNYFFPEVHVFNCKEFDFYQDVKVTMNHNIVRSPIHFR
jgi:hypothetical protein